MGEIEKYPVLNHIVKTLQQAIADAKIENPSPSEFNIKDGNDEIQLKQVESKDGSNATIIITDKRNIIFSEDLLEPLQHMHKEVKGNDELKRALEASTVIINGLDIETELVFQAVKDFLDQVSNSYEFMQVVETNINVIGAGFKFGKHIFRLNITNKAQQISLEPRFTPTFDPTVQQTIMADLSKVQLAVNKMFKKN